MFQQLRTHWREFRNRPAGQRFQHRYRRRATNSGWVRKTVIVSAGAALVVLGIAMIVLPGPGLVAILFGAGLMAEESLVVARILDRLDVAIHRYVARWRPPKK